MFTRCIWPPWFEIEKPNVECKQMSPGCYFVVYRASNLLVRYIYLFFKFRRET